MENAIEKRQLLRNNEYYCVQPEFDKLYHKSLSNHKFRDLMSLIAKPENILLAYRNIKRNGGSKTPGTDGLNILYFEKMNQEHFVKRIQRKLDNYHPKSVKRVLIPKPNGKFRPLGIPCIEDRIIQQAIKQVLEPICEAKFHKQSFGFRPNRNAHHALSRAMYLVNHSKTHYVVDVDIKGFFDNVDHSKLIKQMWALGIQDKNLLMVVKKILKSEIKGIGIPNKGTPQGGVISPLLSNIVLNELDWWISSQWETYTTRHNYGKRRRVGTPYEYIDQSHKYRALRQSSNLKEVWHVRYADDFKIFCKDYNTACKMFIAVKKWLKERLGLDISPEKSKVTNVRKNKTEFLGFLLYARFKRNKYVCKSDINRKAQENIKNKLKAQIKAIQKSQSGIEAIKYNSMVLGFHNYYKVASNCNLNFNLIDYKILRTKKIRLRVYRNRPPCFSKLFLTRYKRYKNATIYTVMDVSLFPVYGVKNEPPISFTPKVCNYTKEGRELIHKNINSNIAVLNKYLLNRRVHNYETELFDNSVALMTAQRGLCGVTKEPLEIGDMELHHKTPRSQGGSNEYKNLIWLKKSIHTLIHAQTSDTVQRYMNMYNGDNEILRRVNKLRALVGNSII